jgi:hypothetical protein
MSTYPVWMLGIFNKCKRMSDHATIRTGGLGWNRNTLCDAVIFKSFSGGHCGITVIVDLDVPPIDAVLVVDGTATAQLTETNAVNVADTLSVPS